MLITAVLLATLASGQAQDTTLPVAKGARLSVNNFSGRITVTAWSRNEVQVRGTSDDEDGRLQVESTGQEVRVSQSMRHGPVDMDITVSLPAWMPVSLQGNETDIAVSGVTGPVRAQSVSGDITLSGGGDNIALSSVEGDIRAEGVRGSIDVQAVDGDVTLRNVTGAVAVSGMDGDIMLDGITGSSARVTTVDGDITFAGTLAGNGTYAFKTHDGDITLRPAGTINATFSVSTWAGEFESDVPVTISGAQSGKRFTFTLGDGSARVELDAFDGAIRLVK